MFHLHKQRICMPATHTNGTAHTCLLATCTKQFFHHHPLPIHKPRKIVELCSNKHKIQKEPRILIMSVWSSVHIFVALIDNLTGVPPNVWNGMYNWELCFNLCLLLKQNHSRNLVFCSVKYLCTAVASYIGTIFGCAKFPWHFQQFKSNWTDCECEMDTRNWTKWAQISSGNFGLPTWTHVLLWS